MHVPAREQAFVFTLVCALVVLAGCGQLVDRVTKPTPEEERQLALACAEFDEVVSALEDALDPLGEMREIVASEVFVPSQRLGPYGRQEEELAGLLAVQAMSQHAATRDSESHRRAYEALDRSIRAWILISEAFDRGEDLHALSDEIGQSMAMLYRAADQHEASCGPPAGVLFANGAQQ